MNITFQEILDFLLFTALIIFIQVIAYYSYNRHANHENLVMILYFGCFSILFYFILINASPRIVKVKLFIASLYSVTVLLLSLILFFLSFFTIDIQQELSLMILGFMSLFILVLEKLRTLDICTILEKGTTNNSPKDDLCFLKTTSLNLKEWGDTFSFIAIILSLFYFQSILFFEQKTGMLLFIPIIFMFIMASLINFNISEKSIRIKIIIFKIIILFSFLIILIIIFLRPFNLNTNSSMTVWMFPLITSLIIQSIDVYALSKKQTRK